MALYDESHNKRPRNAFLEHTLRPIKRFAGLVRNRTNDLRSLMNNEPAFLDQYPSKAVPYIFSKLYTFGLVASRHWDDGANNGFLKLAPVASRKAFETPRNQNIFVGRDGPFFWCQSSISGFVSLTYDADPGNTDATQFGGPTAGDIFDPVLTSNGGAQAMNFFFSKVDWQNKPNISFELELYDRKRQRRLHDGRLPPQLLSGQQYANKLLSNPLRFDPNTEIEPRVYLNEVRMGDLLDTDQAYNAAVFKGYLNLSFIGYKVLDV